MTPDIRLVVDVTGEVPPVLRRQLEKRILFASDVQSGFFAAQQLATSFDRLATTTGRKRRQLVADALPRGIGRAFSTAVRARGDADLIEIAASAAEICQELGQLLVDHEKLVGHFLLEHSDQIGRPRDVRRSFDELLVMHQRAHTAN